MSAPASPGRRVRVESTFSVLGTALPALPTEALRKLLLLIPLHERMRLGEVCTAWRGMLSERSLWMALDLSGASLGMCCSEALLHAASTRALRNARSLDVSGALGEGGLSLEAVRAVAAQHPLMRTLCADELDEAALRSLLQAAPRLTELRADVHTLTTVAKALVRGDEPFAPLRTRRLRFLSGVEAPAGLNPAPFVFLNWRAFEGLVFKEPEADSEDEADAHPSRLALLELLRSLPARDPARLRGLSLPPLDLRALRLAVDAAIALQMQSLSLDCGPTGGAALLTRLLRENGALRELSVVKSRLRCEAGTPAEQALADFCAALRHSKLTAFTMRSRKHYVEADGRVFCALATALAGHAKLQALHLGVPLRQQRGAADPRVPPPAGVAAALAGLASAAALTELNLHGCFFTDDEVAPFLAALAAGAAPRLRSLDLRTAQLSSDFVRDVVTPALLAAACHGLETVRLSVPLEPLKTRCANDDALDGLERAVAAVAAARGDRFVFRAQHLPLCVAQRGDIDNQAPLPQALRAPGLKRAILGGGFAAAPASSGGEAAALLRALVAHPTLEALTLEGNFSRAAEVVGAALGDIIAADAPLETLRIVGCDLGDTGMGPLMAALHRNTRLRVLECRFNEFSPAFAREKLLPAVSANTGLLELSAENRLWNSEGVGAAMAWVARA